MKGPEDILKFWLDEVGPDGWYKTTSEALDTRVREEFEATWEAACEGTFALWLTYPNGALAYCILMDQMPRNMFRGEAKAFLSDRAALAAAKSAIDKGWDLRTEEPARQFFYLPLEHSENLSDQDRCVRLMRDRLPITGEKTLLHARAHRAVIRRFGRFPYRNAALGRNNTPHEAEFLAEGGYGATLRGLQRAADAA